MYAMDAMDAIHSIIIIKVREKQKKHVCNSGS